MILKPKKSNLNEPAILFKRYTVPETARMVKKIDNIYRTDYLAYIPSSQEDADTWSINEWDGFNSVDGRYVWTDGDNYYYSLNANQYMLNKDTNAWEAVTWTFADGISTNIFGRYVWTDGENVYYNSGSPNDRSLYLDKETKTWYPKTWTGLTGFSGDDIWHRGDNIYYSNGSDHYELNIATSTWSAKTWYGDLVDNNNQIRFYGNYIWHIDDICYYSSLYGDQYVLEPESDTWETMTWVGDYTTFSRVDVWNIGNRYYVSSGTNQYELIDGTNQWIEKTWNGLTSLDGIFIKEIYGKYYYLRIATQYVLSEQSIITQYWKFNVSLLNFEEVDYDSLEQMQKDNIVQYTPTIESPLVYVYAGGANAYYLIFVDEVVSWQYIHYDSIDSIATQYEIMEPKINYNDKQYGYQKNLYYNAGLYDYVVTGSIDRSTGQPVKGLMLPTTAQTIRIDEDIPADEEDLIVFDRHLYGIESMEISQKKMPKPFNITYLTLNNIL